MTQTLIIQKAAEEMKAQTLGTTKQFFEIHQIEYSDDKPKIARLDMEQEDTAVVYYPVLNEKFFLAVYLDLQPEVSVRHVDTEPYHCVYFRATSDVLSYIELSAMTTLKATDGWNKGDKKKYRNSFYQFSAMEWEPNPDADEFDDKINKLLDFLDQDQEGIRMLAEKANGYIQIHSTFHNGNTMLGGHHLTQKIIKRMALLNLAIDFDIYAGGNKFK